MAGRALDFEVMQERTKNVPVPVKGITAKEVLKLWQAGKLYQEFSEEEYQKSLLTRCRQEALAYVASINEYATSEWYPHINKVWEMVIYDETLSSSLVMKQKCTMNRYYLTAIVYLLQAKNIYQPAEQVSQLKLHLSLEKISKKNSIYKSVVNYPVSYAQRRRLSSLIENFLVV